MNFLVVGAGAWGTALAQHLARVGQRVMLAPRRPEQARELAAVRENREYLPGIHFLDTVEIVHDLNAALFAAQVVLLACPTQTLRETCGRLTAADTGLDQIELFLSLAKGLERGTHLRPTEVMLDALGGGPVGTLTGPTNAEEVARGLPAAMVLAGPSGELAAKVQAALSGSTLRVYTSDDVVGAELGGSLKNIYAIAAGIGDGLRLGDNARAALLTRALAELVRVGTALGAKTETFYGLSGFGDLVATCHGAWSRNRAFGEKIGAGASIRELLKGRKTVVEGYETTAAFSELCAARGIDAPILREMREMLFAEKKPALALATLMGRGLKAESRGEKTG